MSNYYIFIYYLCSFLLLFQIIRAIEYLNEEIIFCIKEFDMTDLDKSYIEELNAIKSQNYKVTIKPIKTIKKLITTNIIATIIIIVITLPLFVINPNVVNTILLVEYFLLIAKNFCSMQCLSDIKKINI